MEALKTIKLIGNKNDGCVFISFKYRVTKGFKFHARPQTGAYSCLGYWDSFIVFWDMIKTSFREIGKSFRDFGTSFRHLWTKSQESGQAKKSSQGLVRDVYPARFFLF